MFFFDGLGSFLGTFLIGLEAALIGAVFFVLGLSFSVGGDGENT
jgi:hypothetical protein